MPAAKVHSQRMLPASRAEAPPDRAPRFSWLRYPALLLATGYFFIAGTLLGIRVGLPMKLRLWRPSIHQVQAIMQREFVRFLGLASFLGLIKIRWHGLELLPRSGPCIIAPNHPGLLDAVLLISKLPQATCIMRADLSSRPAYWISHMAGYISNDSGPAMVRQCVDRLRKKEILLIFPEGTRTHSPPVNRLKSGFALAAKSVGVPVQCILIRYSHPFLTKSQKPWHLLPLPVTIDLTVSRSFTPAPEENAREFANRVEAYFQEELSQRP